MNNTTKKLPRAEQNRQRRTDTLIEYWRSFVEKHNEYSPSRNDRRNLAFKIMHGIMCMDHAFGKGDGPTVAHDLATVRGVFDGQRIAQFLDELNQQSQNEYLLSVSQAKPDPVPPAPYTADELESDNPFNAWMKEE